jgi:hypothetical protein
MRVKVGNEWFEAKEGQPIMIDLSEADKANIANMAPEATKYAVFDDNQTSDEKLAWMKA